MTKDCSVRRKYKSKKDTVEVCQLYNLEAYKCPICKQYHITVSKLIKDLKNDR